MWDAPRRAVPVRPVRSLGPQSPNLKGQILATSRVSLEAHFPPGLPEGNSGLPTPWLQTRIHNPDLGGTSPSLSNQWSNSKKPPSKLERAWTHLGKMNERRFSRSGVGPEMLPLPQPPRRCWCCWFMDHTLCCKDRNSPGAFPTCTFKLSELQL